MPRLSRNFGLDLREVFVKEPNQRGKERILSKSGQAKYQIELRVDLTPSTRSSFMKFDQSEGIVIDEERGIMTISKKTYAGLAYKDYDRRKAFIVTMNFDPDDQIKVQLTTHHKVGDKWELFDDSDSKCQNSYEDRIFKSFPDDSRMSLSIQKTGNSDSIYLVIDYFPSNSNMMPFRAKPLKRPKAGTMVDFPNTFDLQKTFPPDFYQQRWGEGETWFSIPDGVTDSPGRFRVLTFRENLLKTNKIIYVVIGIGGVSPWTDILSGNDDGVDGREKLWRSYLDSGSRAETRYKCQTSASVTLYSLPVSGTDLGKRLSCTVTVERYDKVKLTCAITCKRATAKFFHECLTVWKDACDIPHIDECFEGEQE
ncbi:hypothetical protein K435DRAFT_857902 [Dendrothele bispora CBS 962.96]|uniref:Uncharacterized protein n=1 Tax=Dendrothele bispora (strain CBS 962.96) TaxID=1314807 RepID=A0A4S8M4G9_DENBC|nr:hypothetical protein K435DRAFT_857902 [Dendrothele bispora CBS 962.96]